MGDRLPDLSGKELVKILERHGFATVRQRGSHLSMRHHDGRTVTTPLNKVVPKGTLRSVMRQAGLQRGDLHTQA